MIWIRTVGVWRDGAKRLQDRDHPLESIVYSVYTRILLDYYVLECSLEL